MPTKSTGTKSSAKRSKTSGVGRGISNLIPEAPTEENVVVKEVVIAALDLETFSATSSCLSL